jgi:hypothetical protein
MWHFWTAWIENLGKMQEWSNCTHNTLLFLLLIRNKTPSSTLLQANQLLKRSASQKKVKSGCLLQKRKMQPKKEHVFYSSFLILFHADAEHRVVLM